MRRLMVSDVCDGSIITDIDLLIGFKATLGILDSIVEHVPTDGPLIIVTASFEGKLIHLSNVPFSH